MNPLVTIIIISYNHNEYINDAIESVYQQSYDNFELLVIDNDSKDGTAGTLKKLSQKYDFKFIKQRNIGAPRTLNKYIPECRGIYIKSFSGDDYLHKDYLIEMVSFMEDNPFFGMAYCRTIFVNKNKEDISLNNNKRYKSGNVFKELIFKKYHPPAPSYIFRKDILIELGLFDCRLKYIEDFYILLSISKEYSIGFLDKYLVYQRKHEDNLTFNANYERQIEEGWIIIYRYNYLEYFKSVKNHFNLHLFAFFSRIDKNYSIKYFIKSLPVCYEKRFIRSTLHMIKLFLGKKQDV